MRRLTAVCCSMLSILCVICAKRADAYQRYVAPAEFADSRTIDQKKIEKINSNNLQKGDKGRPLDAAAMLGGPNQCQITVVDANSSKPVRSYVIHAFIRGRSIEYYFPYGVPHIPGAYDELVKNGEFQLVEQSAVIGRLESNRVNDPTGRCQYDNLGSVTVEFQAIADGYVTSGTIVRIPNEKRATIKLMKTCGFRGRVLGIDGKPFGNGMIDLKGHDRYEVKIDGDGRFDAMGLPPDEYVVEFAGIPRRSYEIRSEPVPAPPLIKPLKLKPGEQRNLGTIRLKAAPILQLRIVDESGAPLPNFPFQVTSPSGAVSGKTDSNGNATLPLVDWGEKADAVVFAPDAMSRNFAPRRLKSKREIEAPRAALPDHPNYVVFKGAPGKVSKVQLTYKQPPGAMNPRFLFLDHNTKKPVASFRGIIDFYGDNDHALADFDNQIKSSNFSYFGSRYFESRDSSGRVLISCVTIPVMNTYPKPGEHICMTVDAQGYARQSFELTLNQLRSGKEQVFELEPEARIVGRVVIAETGEPLNNETLKSLLVRKNQWTEEMKSRWGWHWQSIILKDHFVEGKTVIHAGKNFSDRALAKIKPDGRFEIRGLRPDKHWEIEVGPDEIPKATRKLALEPGLNDIGDIKVGDTTPLTVVTTDENNKPLPGTWVDMPIIIDSQPTTPSLPVTDAAGRISFSMTTRPNHPTIMRLVPHWGVRDDQEQDRRNTPQVFFDAVLDLDARATICTSLPQGHRLTINLPRTKIGDELIRETARERNEEYGSGKFTPFYGIRNVSIQGGAPNQQGFVYHQLFIPEEAIALTTSTMTIHIENVPPGRQQLCIVGSSFRKRSQPTPPVRGEPKGPWPIDNGMPIVYAEIDMPAAPKTVELELNPATVEIALDDPIVQMPMKDLDTYILMDRTAPSTTAFGGDLRRVCSLTGTMFSRTVEEFTRPMVGFEGQFTGGGRMRLVYEPIVFRAVPPGTYTIEVYAETDDIFFYHEPRPFFRKTIEVKPGQNKIRVGVPYRAKYTATPE